MHPFIRILLIAVVVLLFLLAPLAVFSRRNQNSIRKNIETGLKALSSFYRLTPLDAGEFKRINLNALMKFDVAQYRIENLGNLSVMILNSGIMHMLSFVITPFEKNMPLLSNDFIYVFGGQKPIVEFYDLVADKDTADYQAVLSELKRSLKEYTALPDLARKEAWYDNLRTFYLAKQMNDLPASERLFADAVSSFARLSDTLPNLSPEEQAIKHTATCAYINGLLTNGGASTSIFLKTFGEETTRRFFETVMFGTALYQ